MSKASVNGKAKYLLEMLSYIEKIPSVQNAPVIVNEITSTKKLLEDSLFRIAVVGEFSSGKSTFINALLGKDILSHAKSETTAAITHIYNVPESDQRCGTCEILFSDNSTKKLSDYTKLSEYTTVQNGDQVAEKVKLVTVYCHFLSIDHPILIIDTPGLNGIEEGHRELTLNEIQKAHTCIYLLSLDGIKKSDIEFLSMIGHYQPSILFLQNFADKLNASEGDTLDLKIQRAKLDVQEYILPQHKNLNAHFIGISALFALVSKDHTIRKLYETSSDLTEEERVHLYQDSNFTELENYISNLIFSGEYRAVKVNMGVQRCLTLMDEFLADLNLQQKLIQQSENGDPEKVRLALAENAKKQLSDNRDDRIKRLHNFIIDKSNTLKKAAFTQFTESIAQFIDLVRENVETEIPNYAALQSFCRNHGNLQPPAYFADKINKQLKAGVFTDIWNLTRKMIQSLYNQAMDRVSEYIVVPFQASGNPVSLPALDASFQMDRNMEVSHSSYISALEKTIADLQKKIQDYRSQISSCQWEISQLDPKISKAKSELSSAELGYRSKVQELGPKPGPVYITKYQTVTKKKRILIFWEKEYNETVPYKEPDFSDQRDWNKRKDVIETAWREKKKELQNRIDALISQKEELELDVRYASSKIEKENEKIKQTKVQIREEKEVYQKRIAMEKEKTCQRYKRNLLTSIESCLMGEEGNTAYTFMQVRIESVFEKNTPIIEKQIIDTYNQSVNAKLKEVDNLIQSLRQGLTVRYKTCDADIEKMNALRSALCNEFEIRSTGVKI